MWRIKNFYFPVGCIVLWLTFSHFKLFDTESKDWLQFFGMLIAAHVITMYVQNEYRKRETILSIVARLEDLLSSIAKTLSLSGLTIDNIREDIIPPSSRVTIIINFLKENKKKIFPKVQGDLKKLEDHFNAFSESISNIVDHFDDSKSRAERMNNSQAQLSLCFKYVLNLKLSLYS